MCACSTNGSLRSPFAHPATAVEDRSGASSFDTTCKTGPSDGVGNLDVVERVCLIANCDSSRLKIDVARDNTLQLHQCSLH